MRLLHYVYDTEGCKANVLHCLFSSCWHSVCDILCVYYLRQVNEVNGGDNV